MDYFDRHIKEMEIKRQKEQKKKEKIMEIVIIAFIITIFIIIMNFFDKSYKEGMENCMNAGHSRYYCEKGM